MSYHRHSMHDHGRAALSPDSIILLYFFFFSSGPTVTLIDNVSSSLDLSLRGDKSVQLAYTVPEAEEDTDASHLFGYIPLQGERLFCSGNLPGLFSVY